MISSSFQVAVTQVAIADSTHMHINFVCQICIVQMAVVSSLSRSITTGRRKNVYDPLIDQLKARPKSRPSLGILRNLAVAKMYN